MNQPTVGMTVRLPKPVLIKAKAAASEQGMTLTVWVRKAMQAALRGEV